MEQESAVVLVVEYTVLAQASRKANLEREFEARQMVLLAMGDSEEEEPKFKITAEDMALL